MNDLARKHLTAAQLVLIVLAVCLQLRMGERVAKAENSAERRIPLEGLIVDPVDVTPTKVMAWKNEGFKLLVLTLDERFEPAIYKNAAKIIAAESIDLYYWIEVARNPTLAREHPEWMASLGSHNDWRTRFPDVPKLKEGEVAKAWPWTPIGYRQSFDAHLARISGLLRRVPENYRGLLFNDLQGGPSSCGCGNLQCRWAIDYGVPSTTDKFVGTDAAAMFIAEVRRLAADKEVIPVWTTECEEHDLASDKQPHGGWSTGYCGGIECFNHQCPIKFTEQWQALHATHRGPTGILLLHKEFQRDRKEYGAPASWTINAIEQIDDKAPTALPRKKLWLVVQGYEVKADEESAARQAALRLEPAAVLVARTRIDQSFEPRIINRKPK
jgi:hypothetical protein